MKGERGEEDNKLEALMTRYTFDKFFFFLENGSSTPNRIKNIEIWFKNLINFNFILSYVFIV